MSLGVVQVLAEVVTGVFRLGPPRHARGSPRRMTNPGLSGIRVSTRSYTTPRDTILTLIGAEGDDLLMRPV